MLMIEEIKELSRGGGGEGMGRKNLITKRGGLEGRLRGRIQKNKLRCHVMKTEAIEGWMSDIRT